MSEQVKLLSKETLNAVKKFRAIQVLQKELNRMESELCGLVNQVPEDEFNQYVSITNTIIQAD